MPAASKADRCGAERGCCSAGAVAGVSELTATSAEAATQLLLARAQPVTGVERVPILQCLGRVLAQSYRSHIDVPPVDNSAMDGYALAGRDIAAHAETRLPVSQRIQAGHRADTLVAGTAARIFTGGCIPAGADAVVMQEVCRAERGAVVIRGPVEAGQHIRRAGEDISAGTPILSARTQVRPQDLGLAASIGLTHLDVYRRVRVVLFSTGDELIEPGQSLPPGAIYNSNRYTLHALLSALGCGVVDLGIVRDDRDTVRSMLRSAAEQGDLIVTSGGVSVGEEDHVRGVVGELGSVELWRLAIKPGKPLAFGQVAGTPFLGLPGNPVSAFVTFCLFGRPYVLRTQGLEDVLPRPITARACFEHRPRGSRRREFLRARLERAEDGSLAVSTHSHQGSGVLTSTGWANGLAVISEGRSVADGDSVEFLPFSELLS